MLSASFVAEQLTLEMITRVDRAQATSITLLENASDSSNGSTMKSLDLKVGVGAYKCLTSWFLEPASGAYAGQQPG